MVNDLEKKHKFKRKKKEDVIKILGKESENKNRIYYFIKSEWIKCYYYCLEYDENNLITKVYIDID